MISGMFSTLGSGFVASDPFSGARESVGDGLSGLPRLAEGRVPLQVALLSPAGRPIALTGDLAGFWKAGWLDARKDMRGRYPKHNWPEDPATAQADPPKPGR